MIQADGVGRDRPDRGGQARQGLAAERSVDRYEQRVGRIGGRQGGGHGVRRLRHRQVESAAKIVQHGLRKAGDDEDVQPVHDIS